MSEMIPAVEREMKRIAFVESYLSCGSPKEAAKEAGYEGNPWSFLNAAKTIKLLKERLPQRNPEEMSRVYGIFVKTLNEAQRRYASVKLKEDQASDVKERKFMMNQNNMRFQQLMTAVDMVGRAAGLQVKVNLHEKEEEGVRVVREIHIVVNSPNKKVEEVQKLVDAECKVIS